MKFSFAAVFPTSFARVSFTVTRGMVALRMVALTTVAVTSAAFAAATLSGCAASSSKGASAASADVTPAPGEARCWEALNQDHVLVCRAEARMRAARRERHLALFDCYDDKVQQMHVLQRALVERSNVLGADTPARSSNPFAYAEPEARKTRLMELWGQLNACPAVHNDALASATTIPVSTH